MKTMRPVGRDGRRPRRALLAIAAALAALPALAQVPGRVNFQGLLLDSGGAPLNGVVDLDFALYPTAQGGSAVWTESKPAVSVSDGIYDVELGSTTPLTPSLLAPGTLYLEVTIEGEVLTPRRPLLAVPYALRASSAETVAGVPSDFVVQIFEQTDLDSNGLLNSDPAEGLGDTDGDGADNYVDSDNDGDGLSDQIELGQGSDINLVTPTISSFSPTTLPDDAPATVTIQGSAFDEPGLSVSFGSESPGPTNVTPTSFDVVVGPQPAGFAPVMVSLGNGEATQEDFLFRRVVTAFVTSTSYPGLLPGLGGADANCATQAAAAGLPGTYLAWLRDGGGSANNPESRFSYPGQSAIYRRTDGVQFNDPTASTTPLDSALDRDEFGAAVAAGTTVWTGGGSFTGGFNCVAWTQGVTGQGITGTVGDTGVGWQSGTASACSVPQRLYCFEQ